MIITCNNCNKKFDIDSNLIPEKEDYFSVIAVIINGFLKKKL